MSDERSYPSRPLVGVSCAVWRGEDVLLVQRAKPPLQGLWSLPGGLVEAGETLDEAVRREVREETGIEIAPAGFVDTHESIVRDGGGRVERHFVLWVYAARFESGEPLAASDAAALCWCRPDALGPLPTTALAAEFIARSRAVVFG